MVERTWGDDAFALWGRSWITSLSVVLATSRRTVERWCSREPPDRVREWLRQVVESDPPGAACYGALLLALTSHEVEGRDLVPPTVLSRLFADLTGEAVPPWSTERVAELEDHARTPLDDEVDIHHERGQPFSPTIDR